MGKEIKVGVDRAHLEAFVKSIENNPKIDFRSFNPHLAIRCRIAEELNRNGSVRVSANVNGGPLHVHVNGDNVDEGGAVTRLALESVVNVYSPGRGSQIASSMLRGAVLVLRGT